MSIENTVGLAQQLPAHLQDLVASKRRWVAGGDVEVNRYAIRAWCDAMGDRNPIYGDVRAAQAQGYDGIVAPPTMLRTWTSPGLAVSKQKSANALLRSHFAEIGFDSVLGVEYSQEFLRYIELGERLTETSWVDSISSCKNTARGQGHFARMAFEWTSSKGDIVGRSAAVALFFRSPDLTPRSKGPRPTVNRDNKFWWDAVATGRLVIQKCRSCSKLRHPTAPMCPACRSLEWDVVDATGKGAVFSFVVHHHPPLPGMTLPYIVATIELDEGIRIVSNVIDIEPEKMKIGMRVQVVFCPRDGDDFVLPLFRPLDVAGKSSPALSAAISKLTASTEKGKADLPILEIPLTATSIIAGAIASNDFEKVHHDPDLARSQGLNNIIMNILTTCGLVGRYVTDWSGSQSNLKGVSLKLAQPNYPGDTLTLAGWLDGKTSSAGAPGETSIRVLGTNSLGKHVEASVLVERK